MRRTEEEKNLLAKLASGVLDGMVGDEREYRGYRSVFCGKYIKDGEPVSYRQGESTRFFNGKENERIPGKREDEHYDTDDRKLEFLQRYSPTWIDGKKHARNVYAHTREECEEKLKVLIAEMKAELAELKRQKGDRH